MDWLRIQHITPIASPPKPDLTHFHHKQLVKNAKITLQIPDYLPVHDVDDEMSGIEEKFIAIMCFQLLNKINLFTEYIVHAGNMFIHLKLR